jgi:small-conductance mechanosensitive channel
MKDLFIDRIKEVYEGFLQLLPDLVFGALFFVFGFILIRLIRKQLFSRIVKRAKDPVASQFVTDILTGILYIILTVFTFKVIGLSKLTQTIIGAAGLTTFIIGFALKDIGENFLAGIVMIFDRPFEMGDLIELDGRMGRVIRISIRETTVKTIDGRDVYFPNSDIIKKPFTNYTIDDQLRDSFELQFKNDQNIREIMDIIMNVVISFNPVLKAKKPSINITDLLGGRVRLAVNYWYSLRGTRSRDGKLKTDIILAVTEKLKEEGIEIV